MLRFSVEARKEVGRGPCRRMRRKGTLPVILYGSKGAEGICLQMPHDPFLMAQSKAGFFENPIEIEWTSEQGIERKQVKIKEIQRHPYKNKLLHVDFQEV